MMAKGRQAVFAALIPLPVLAALIGMVPASAEPQADFSFNVKPVRLALPADKAHSVQTVTVSNRGRQRLHIDSSVVEFSQAPDGRISLVRPAIVSAAAWVEPAPKSFDVGPGQEQAVTVSITRPTDPEPGDRQVAVVFQAPAQAAGGNIVVSPAIAVELLINVPGPVIHNIQIGPVLLPRFAESGPVPIRVSVRNLGNVHQDYIASRRLVATVPGGHQIQFPDFTVLRDSTRQVETDWLTLPIACICEVVVTGNDGEGNPITSEADVMVFPFRTVAGLLMAIAGLLVLRDQIIRRQRRLAAARLDEKYKAEYQVWT